MVNYKNSNKHKSFSLYFYFMAVKCTVSGSLRKFHEGILTAIGTFESNGIEVLSPKRSKIVGQKDGFVFLESDKTRNIKALENHHLEAIKNSQFLYVFNQNSYLGNAAIFEMGYAHGKRILIFGLEPVNDVTLKEYVSDIISPDSLCLKIKKGVYKF